MSSNLCLLFFFFLFFEKPNSLVYRPSIPPILPTNKQMWSWLVSPGGKIITHGLIIKHNGY